MPGFIKKIIFVIGSFFILLAIFLAGIFWLNQGKIILGTVLAGENYGGLTPAQAQEKLNQKISQYQKNGLAVTFRGAQSKLLPAQLGLQPESKTTLERLMTTGHEGPWWQQLKVQASYLLFPQNQNLNFSVRHDKLRLFFEQTLNPVEVRPQNAAVKFAKPNRVTLEAAKEGLVFEKDQILAILFASVSQLQTPEINLVLKQKQPDITDEKAEPLFNLTKKIIARSPLLLQTKSQEWKIEAANLFSWFDFQVVSKKKLTELQKEYGLEAQDDNEQTETREKPEEKFLFLEFKQEEINETLAALAPSVNQESRNARLKKEDGQVLIVKPSASETRLDITKSARQIIVALYEGETTISLVVNEKPAAISFESLKELGLTDFLGLGSSNFAGSSASRQHNVKTGMAKFDGLLLKPGETFSFNTLLGEVDAANGYLPELVIKPGKTTPEYGGGLCQVSTTLFRAAVNSGLRVTERFPHAFPVKYYNPQGFDATIYPPHPDLQFINDTPGHIYIQGFINGTELSFEFYGQNDGRQVTVKGPYVLETGEDGSMKTLLTQEIWRDGKLEDKRSFYSSYKSPALYPVEKNPLE